MKPLVLVLAAVASLAPAPSGAQTRATTRMSCAEATALVKREGDLLLGTGPALTERLVRDRSLCEATEAAELRFVPTRDNPLCPAGYRCREPDYEDWDWEWISKPPR